MVVLQEDLAMGTDEQKSYEYADLTHRSGSLEGRGDVGSAGMENIPLSCYPANVVGCRTMHCAVQFEGQKGRIL